MHDVQLLSGLGWWLIDRCPGLMRRVGRTRVNGAARVEVADVVDFSRGAVEPSEVARDVESVAPAFEAFEVGNRAAGAFQVADAALGEVEPGGEGGLRHGWALGLAVGAEDLADVARLERLADGGPGPELRRQRRGPECRCCGAAATLFAPVVTGQQGVTRAAASFGRGHVIVHPLVELCLLRSVTRRLRH